MMIVQEQGNVVKLVMSKEILEYVIILRKVTVLLVFVLHVYPSTIDYVQEQNLEIMQPVVSMNV